MKGKLLFSSVLIAIFFSTSNAAQQAIQEGKNVFITPMHQFNNEDVYDYEAQKFKRLNGKNFYAVKSDGDIKGAILIFNNPKNPNSTTDLELGLEVLIPDFNEQFRIDPSQNKDSEFVHIQQPSFIPFLVSAYSNLGNVDSNKLILSEGEMSSVYFLQPSDIQTTPPQATGNDDRINFLITAGFTNSGNALNNLVEIKRKAYVNMGVENPINLPLNGAPLVVGGMSLNGEAKDNAIILHANAMIDLHPSRFIQISGSRKYDERMTHIIGGLAHDANTQNNKVTFNGSKFILHGSNTAYTSLAATHVAGGICLGKNKSCDAINNLIEINELDLDLRVNTKGGVLLAYDAVVNEIFYGGRSNHGNANGNKIIVRDLQTTLNLNSSIKISTLIDFYGGYAVDGEANFNQIEANLNKPLKTNSNFIGRSEFNFYGGYASKGASNNHVLIKYNLTPENTPENHSDKIQIIGASTLSGKADKNKVSVHNVNVDLPLFVYAVAKRMVENQDFYADSASDNSIDLKEIKSGRALNSTIEAKQLFNNSISYDFVQSLSPVSSNLVASKASIKASEISKNNTIKISDYSAATRENVYVIRGDKEVLDNKIYLKNVTFGTASDKREGVVIISSGMGANSHNNLLSIVNLNIDEYYNSSIFIAPSAYFGEKNGKISQNNTLYMGGIHNIFQGVKIDAISGSFAQDSIVLNGIQTFKTTISPSSEVFTKGNHFIVDSSIEANTINNFEHYSFILSDKIKQNKAILSVEKTPLNLSSKAVFSLYVKNGFSVKAGDKIKIIENKAGFTDVEGRALDLENLKFLIQTINKNHESISIKNIPNLKDAKLDKINYSLEVNDDGTILYMNII